MGHISISENGVWAGNGALVDGVIEDCPAVLGRDQDMSEAAYAAIEQAIAAGNSRASIGDYTWTWDIDTSHREVE